MPFTGQTAWQAAKSRYGERTRKNGRPSVKSASPTSEGGAFMASLALVTVLYAGSEQNAVRLDLLT